jgi:hypothetical protein
MMNKIVVIHAEADTPTAMLLRSLIESENYRVLLNSSITSGHSLSRELTDSISNAHAILVLLSRHSKGTRWLEQEIAVILEKGHTVIPILLDDSAKENWIWPLLSDRRAIQFYSSSNPDRIVSIVKTAVEGPISPDYIDVTISDMALAFSRRRKIKKLYGSVDALEMMMPSTDKEKESDWQEAEATFSLNVLKRLISFTQLSPESYLHLENTWIRKAKEILGYYYWLSGSTFGHYIDFMHAGEEIRKWLLNRDQLEIKDFATVKYYLSTRYLKSDLSLNDESDYTIELIGKKAHRIWEINKNSNKEINWYRAKLYVKLFYENIIEAIVEKDKNKIAKILEAFEFSKAQENGFLIINTFEVALAVEFIDKNVLAELIDTPTYDLNLVPLEKCPASLKEIICFDENLEFHDQSCQLIYHGKMPSNTLQKLISAAEEDSESREANIVAIQHLYQQSQQLPFRDQIL